MAMARLASKFRYFCWRVWSILKPKQPGSHLCLRPASRTLLQRSEHITNIPPSNVTQLATGWTPAPQWVELDTKDVYLNIIAKCNVAPNGILFRGLCAYAGSYVYPAFYDRLGVAFLLSIYRSSQPKVYDDSHEYLVVHDHWSAYNYFHWICDALPRLYLFKKHFPGKTNVRVLLPADAPRFIFDSVVMMGFDFSPIGTTEYACVQKVYHLDYIADSGFTTHTLTEAVRHILPADQPAPWRKVYISRGKASRRTIINEDQIIAILKAKGFEILFTETLSLQQQIDIFSTAAVLVSSHGAGLTNMLFMPEGGEVIELALADTASQTMCYWTMANAKKFKYSYVPVRNGENDNFIVTEETIKVLKNALEGN